MKFPRYSAWVDEKDLKPYEEFREQMQQRKTEQRTFLMALLDIATYLRDPREFAGLFEAFEVSEDKPAQDPDQPEVYETPVDFDQPIKKKSNHTRKA